jgi:hypothetical protein
MVPPPPEDGRELASVLKLDKQEHASWHSSAIPKILEVLHDLGRHFPDPSELVRMVRPVSRVAQCKSDR